MKNDTTIRWILLLAVLLVFAMQPPAQSKSKAGKNKGQGKKSGQQNLVSPPDDELAIIRAYLGQDGNGKKKGKQPKPLPPGLQKKMARGWNLPPGWQKKLQRGEVLPVDLYARAEKLPEDLLRKLPPQRKDVEAVILENKVVKILRKTREILDILDL